MVRPSIFRCRAQSVIRVTARSMWPCSAHFVSYMGDLAGMRMYSVSAGTMSASQACWTKRARAVGVSSHGPVYYSESGESANPSMGYARPSG